MSDASVTPGRGSARVRLERRLSDPAGVVWRALTDRAQLAAWFPCDVDVEGGEWKVGAALRFVFPAHVIDLTMTGEVLAVEHERVLSFTWGDEVLRFELTADGDATVLVLYDELAPGRAARNAAGWETCLDRLSGASPGADAWRPHFERYRTKFEPLLGAQEGQPEGYKGE